MRSFDDRGGREVPEEPQVGVLEALQGAVEVERGPVLGVEHLGATCIKQFGVCYVCVFIADCVKQTYVMLYTCVHAYIYIYIYIHIHTGIRYVSCLCVAHTFSLLMLAWSRRPSRTSPRSCSSAWSPSRAIIQLRSLNIIFRTPTNQLTMDFS